MNQLYSALASLEFNALPQRGFYTFDEWFGPKPPYLCLDIHCHQKIHRSFHFCPRCARGIRPCPCHHWPKMNPTSAGCPTPSLHDPAIVVFHIGGESYKLAAVKCLDCGQSTAVHGRVSHALDHWNRDGLFDRPIEHPFPPCPQCKSNKFVAFRGDFAQAYCGPCGVRWETTPTTTGLVHAFSTPGSS